MKRFAARGTEEGGRQGGGEPVAGMHESEEREDHAWFAPGDKAALDDYWRVHQRSVEALPSLLAPAFALQPDRSPPVPHTGDPTWDYVERICAAWGSRSGAAWADLEPSLLACHDFFSTQGIGFGTWVEACLRLQSELTARLIDTYGSDPARLAASLRVLQCYATRTLATIAESISTAKDRLLALERQHTEQATTRFKRLAESGILGILICDFQGKIVEANDSFLTTFGHSREELNAGAVGWGSMTPPEWRQQDDAAIEQLLSVGRTRPWEKEYFHKDGRRIPILVGVAMLNTTQTIAFVLDISERKRLEEIRNRSLELETQNRRIQEASRLKSEFLANMSHELRTPLNSILGFTELLHDGEIEPGTPQYLESLEDILNSGRHLQQLINDVLDLAKVEAGKIELRPKLVDISELISEVTAILRTVAASKQLRVEAHVAPEVRHATLDPGRFKQVLYNYLSNALKFTPEGGRVLVRGLVEGSDCLRVVVEDSGIGIAPEDLGRLFVEFQQLEAGATKRHAGTGLGLALTKRLVEAQGGSVGVKSELGRGSQFFAILPLHATSFVAPVAQPLTELTVPNGAACVLVVDDDARDRAPLVQTLSRAGYGVHVVSSGGQALACCAEQVFDAITLDLLLPDMTGLDVLHSVRLSGMNRETPVVVVSVVAERCIVAGFGVQDYLTKPVDGQDLLAALERAGVPPARGGSILVVDDDPAAHRLMQATLEKLGYEICCTPHGEAALQLAVQHQPLAVILDLMMPGMDGFDFLKRFRAQRESLSVPVIVWTMKELDEGERRGLQSLAQRVVGKDDWTPAAFVAEVRRLIAAQRRPSGSGGP